MAAYKHNVQYIRYYTDGTAARKIETTVSAHKTATLPKPRKEKRRKLYVDPVAILGVVVACCMLVVLAMGITQLQEARAQEALMERYVSQLTRENEELTVAYANSYNLAEVEKTALALGMIPSAEAQQTQIQVIPPEEVEEPTIWETIGTFLTDFFA